ncbi:uncharacterized protein RAG0_03505 [Rhynchosporium agropyri]|uniref:Uncharacterized protein n=3 Tax=Rhynchosporium TaxID=38037 RepID=A0A1E1MTC2_RHYSE|nr:uncharacterized protein RAG0_03505 [Rhynchosporium agropyri]CZT05613.1 uncharacterized protein RCO7_10403 [Rhynchosporium commune]CZT52336.1 uncharacterized protein RSE6_13648 [Rhynchosporium secalis]
MRLVYYGNLNSVDLVSVGLQGTSGVLALVNR